MGKLKDGFLEEYAAFIATLDGHGEWETWEDIPSMDRKFPYADFLGSAEGGLVTEIHGVVRQYVQNIADGRPRSMLLIIEGDYGVGKTTLYRGILRDLSSLMEQNGIVPPDIIIEREFGDTVSLKVVRGGEGRKAIERRNRIRRLKDGLARGSIAAFLGGSLYTIYLNARAQYNIWKDSELVGGKQQELIDIILRNSYSSASLAIVYSAILLGTYAFTKFLSRRADSTPRLYVSSEDGFPAIEGDVSKEDLLGHSDGHGETPQGRLRWALLPAAYGRAITIERLEEISPDSQSTLASVLNNQGIYVDERYHLPGYYTLIIGSTNSPEKVSQALRDKAVMDSIRLERGVRDTPRNRAHAMMLVKDIIERNNYIPWEYDAVRGFVERYADGERIAVSRSMEKEITQISTLAAVKGESRVSAEMVSALQNFYIPTYLKIDR